MVLVTDTKKIETSGTLSVTEENVTESFQIDFVDLPQLLDMDGVEWRHLIGQTIKVTIEPINGTEGIGNGN